MKIKIIALGKVKEKYLSEGIDEFQKRLKPYVNLEIIELNQLEIKDENLTEKILDKEGEKILSCIKPDAYVITLEIEGKSLSSVEFSKQLEKLAIDGYGEIVFIIGSSCGLSKNVSNRADFKLSMSKMTFLHNFARLILLEQIYRAFKIQKGETYHK
jgi:23S rRNA (pseudouridine1915-N3)-methyltransferase